MFFSGLLVAAACLLGSARAQTSTDSADPPAPTPTGIDTFANVTVYQPDNPSTELFYARTESLPNNTVLAAWNDPAQENNTISIYRSQDSGFSWYSFGSATSSEDGRRLLQPHLLYLNSSFNGDSGAVLLAVNAVDDKSTNIEVYASYDQGESFELASQIVSGGPLAANGTTAVSNPFLVQHGESLTIYYSIQGGAQYAQKIVQQTTTSDYDSWTSAIDVVASQSRDDKPGMASTTKLPNGKYIIVFENARLDSTSKMYTYPIYFKIAASPENASTERTQEIKVDTGNTPIGGPFVTWTPLGGANGTIVLSDSHSNSVFINQALGEGTWKEVKTTAGRAFAREVRVPNNDQTKLRLACGAEYGQQTPSQILVTVMDFQKALLASK